ncbi:MAG: thiamine-monophosphate kinase [Bacteroidia bacterium]|jgi:thiamine-monophosphate kinase
MPADEFSLIQKYFSSLDKGSAIALGVGDDCALLNLLPTEHLAVSTDTMVSGQHFHAHASPDDIAYRCVVAAASDLAAMGARPMGMTLALTLPQADETWLEGFSHGLTEASHACQLPLAGGDTTAGPLTITVQVMGAVPRDAALLRSGAQLGDQVCVSGTLGDAAAALSDMNGEWQPAGELKSYLQGRFYRPETRLALGQSLLGLATAAIDISDGLLADAGHIASASGVGIEIDPALLPLSAAVCSCADEQLRLQWALAGGDDYELCFCLPAQADVPEGCTRVGQVVPGEGVHAGVEIDIPAGYQHF